MRLAISLQVLASIALIAAALAAEEPAKLSPAEYADQKQAAEKLVAEKSYAQAHEAYERLAKAAPTAEAERWVQFRLADTLWRDVASSDRRDTSKFDEARRQLRGLIDSIRRNADRDRVWAEAHESLADSWWNAGAGRNWGQAWNHYHQALGWWAASPDIDLARERYLGIIRKATDTAREDGWYDGSYYYAQQQMSPALLEDALSIAVEPDDRARLHYLLARVLEQQGDWHDRLHVGEHYQAVIELGRKTEWYDDALYAYAQYVAQYGEPYFDDEGNLHAEADYVKALALYEKLTSAFEKGETRFYDDAVNAIKHIKAPTLGIGVGNAFLPGSLAQYHLSWRNIKEINLALYSVTLVEDVQLEGDISGWLDSIEVNGREAQRLWTYETGDKGEYRPGNESLSFDEPLKPGAYLIVATGAGQSARELILVTDASLVVNETPDHALIYYCDALTGAPIAEANIAAWAHYYDGDKWRMRTYQERTNADGLVLLDTPTDARQLQLLVTGAADQRQAFARVGHYYSYESPSHQWKIYAFTDRPAYRPGDTVRWKFILRRGADGHYETPAGTTIKYAIMDARGNGLVDQQVELNDFGSASGEFEIPADRPLGEYTVNFHHDTDGIGHATLFRVEEYKLPEFKVSVETPKDEEGHNKVFRLGERVEVAVQADYYFGGPVANADVELVINQSPYYHDYTPPHEYPWYYSRDSYWGGRHYYGGRQEIARVQLQTDASGRVTHTFETPDHQGSALQYTIEARVTDASRREITATGTVRVTQQGYYVYLTPQRHVYQPGDRVQVDVKAIDANNQPQSVTGQVTVTRAQWYEIWIAPDGREVSGDELDRIRRDHLYFPPVPQHNQPGWRLKKRGYEHEEVLTQQLKTDDDGHARLEFKPDEIGYYICNWKSPDPGYPPIKAQTTVWVCDREATHIGYRPSGIDVIVDRDTFKVGETAPVMVTMPRNDTYVLFTVQTDDLDSYRVVHLTGTAKVIELPITAAHVPNIFLTGASVQAAELLLDTEEVIVPPEAQFLTVEVTANQEAYEPRETGTLTIQTTDHEGKPVAAEVALSVADEAVYYIQQEYAGDPREFFYGSKRRSRGEWATSFQAKRYTRLIRNEEGNVVDVPTLARRLDEGPTLARRAGMAGDAGIRDQAEYFFEAGESQWGDEDFARRRGGRMDARAKSLSDELSVAPARQLATRTMPAAAPADMPAEEPMGELDADGFIDEQNVTVRSDFRATAFWQPSIVTDADGYAEVEVKYPDSLTTWQATARAITTGTQVGWGKVQTRTRQPLIVRLQAPRFFLVGDTVTLSAVINNNLEEPQTVAPKLDVTGLTLVDAAEPEPVEVPVGGEVRVDWHVRVEQPGAATLKVFARGREHADAMERTYPVHEHGLDRLIAKGGKVRGDDVTVKLNIPAERRQDSTKLTVQVTPSIAVTMLDALPYLIDYPYGCNEQTMSRFLPAVITAKTLGDLGISRETVANRLFGGIEQAPENLERLGERNLGKLDDVIAASLDRLYDSQRNDGGWGWWKEPVDHESDHFMSAYVVWGLALAQDADIDVDQEVLKRGVKFLDLELVEEENDLDEQAFMLHALAVYHNLNHGTATPAMKKALENLYSQRDRLRSYSRALLALSAHYMGDNARTNVLAGNLANGVIMDETPDTSVIMRGEQESHPAVIATAHWGEDGIYYRWSDGGEEATAFNLMALLAINPDSDLIEPTVNWLVKNRRGAQWRSTRDTAIIVLALNRYLQQSGELERGVDFEVQVNGRTIATRSITADELIAAPSRFTVDRELIRDGENEVRIIRTGGAAELYFSVEAAFHSYEVPIPPAGNELFVRRQYYRVVMQPTLLEGLVARPIPLNDGDTIISGERVWSVITIEAKNNYEYLVFEDLKPAGFESVQVRSGEPCTLRELRSEAYHRQFGTETTAERDAEEHMERDPRDYTGATRGAHQELRDRKVAMFVDRLPEGVWELRYELRAEVPGHFHAMPTIGYAMYVPEIRCNGQEIRVEVVEEE